jgi:predicted Zn-dependent protease
LTLLLFGISYYAESQARQILIKLDEQKIRESEAIKQLQDLQRIAPDNPVVLNLLDVVEEHQEAQRIAELMELGHFEEAIIKAKQSRHQRLRHKVALWCLDIFIKGLENKSLPLEILKELAIWAYELDPNNPDCEYIYNEIYRRF